MTGTPTHALADAPTDPIEIVDAFMAAFVAMDFDAALPYLADDCEYTNIPMSTVRGHAGVREVLEPFFAPILENEFTAAKIHDPAA